MKTHALRHGASAVVGAIGLLLCGGAIADEALARNKGCLTCHHAERKGIGPSFGEVAARYRNDGTAADMLARKIREGGRGVWGDGIMPPNPHVNPADSAKLAAWILGSK